MRLETLTFNHDPGSSVTSALNVRQNANQPATIPEWRRGMPADAVSAAAYALTEATAPEIRARLRDPALAGGRVEVRALEPPIPSWWTPDPPADPIAYLQWLAPLTTNLNVLGSVAARVVDLDAQGDSGETTFRLAGSRLRQAAVGVYPVTWRWQWRRSPADPWADLATTRHQIHVVLRTPREPWTQQPFTAANTQLPWLEVLAHACRWGFSARDLDDTAARVNGAVFGLGPGIVEYGCATGGVTAYAFPHFNCTAFLERLRGGRGNGRFINCSDCATIVSTFANALGCELWQSRMSPPTPTVAFFPVRPLQAIGTLAVQQPCGWWPGFSYHEVAWKDACTATDDVFDACLALDAGVLPGTPVLVLPSNLLFGQPGDRRYRDLLATPTGQLLCQPQPITRQRRKVF